MKIKDTKYFGVKLSTNRIKNNKGQLIVPGCTFARTGKQKYHTSELGITDKDEFIYLDRPVKEVSDPATVASFEGCPLTYEHPEDDVKVGVNYAELAKGMATNVKYISDSTNSGHLVADLIFTDPDLIKMVENHEINELSAGYNCDVDETTWTQTKIRGNHIAVVECARAGHQAMIRDSVYKFKKFVDSYEYTVEVEGVPHRFVDYYDYNEDNELEVVETKELTKPVEKRKGFVKPKNFEFMSNPKNAIWVQKPNREWVIWGGTNNDTISYKILQEFKRKYIAYSMVSNGDSYTKGRIIRLK